jgi:hypothetical protein
MVGIAFGLTGSVAPLLRRCCAADAPLQLRRNATGMVGIAFGLTGGVVFTVAKLREMSLAIEVQ